MELQVHNPLKLLANLSANPLYHLITQYYYCPLIMCVLSHKSCPTLFDPMDCSPPGSSVHGIFQARILEWVAISFSRGFSSPRDQTWVSCIAGRLFLLLSHQGSPCLLNKKLLKSVLLIITSKGENTIQILELVLQWREKMLKLNHHRNVLEKLNFMWLFSVLKTKQSLRSLLPRNLNSWVFLLYRNTLKKYVNCSFSLRLIEGVTGRES